MIWHFSHPERRMRFLKRTWDDNIVDTISLGIQGLLIPFFQFLLIYYAFDYIAPSFKNSIVLPQWVGFLINFIFIDFLYYIIHRAMHSDLMWGLHLLHHSAQDMDIVVSSRNSVWTSFFFPYLWLNSFFIFALENKSGYIIAVSLTAMLDLWRHSRMTINPHSQLYEVVSLVLLTPLHHAWHHSRKFCRVNFGANLCIWDRLFGTYKHPHEFPVEMGLLIKSDLKTKLFLPFRLQRENQGGGHDD